LAQGRYAAEIVPSPDGQWLAYKSLHQAYVTAWPPRGGAPMELGSSDGGTDVTRLSADLGEWLHWTSPDELTYGVGNTLYRVGMKAGLPPEPKPPDVKPSKKVPWPVSSRPPVGASMTLRVEVKRSPPSQAVVLDGATVITMNGDEVLRDAVVVVQGERIAAVGARGAVAVPRGAKVIDMRGKWIIPGLVDVHAHMGYGHGDITAEVLPAYAANLAYGVTTTHDPSAETSFVFASRELVEAGRRVGPRILSTGYILYGADSDDKAVVESLDDARGHLSRLAHYGAFSVKSYNQPRRDQRRWILAAAREQGMLVVPEGGSTLAHNLTMIVDGHTDIEHAIPVEQLREDVVRLWRQQTGVHYTPTLLVGYGGIWGENTFYQRYDVWRDEKLQHFTPPGVLEARGKRRPLMAPEEDWQHKRLAATAWRLASAGVRVNLGAHGQLQGLGPHWELWAMVDGGFPNHDALRVATLNGALTLGIDGDVGSVQPGRLADLVVLDADPLADIHNTTRISGVWRGGVLYDPNTLATSYPEVGPPLATPWAAGHNGAAWTWDIDSGCGCQ
jgi:imidazolonepropionase-like amidohydrolase